MSDKIASGHPASEDEAPTIVRAEGMVSSHATTYADSPAAGSRLQAAVTAPQEKDRLAHQAVGVARTGGNMDAPYFAQTLAAA
jgi:hypothetical protein